MTFVHPADTLLLSKYSGSIHITAFNNMEMMENIDIDGPVDYYKLLEHPSYFAIISDSEYKLFTPRDIIEAVMTLRHTLTTWQVVNKFTSGDKWISPYDDTNVLISIVLSHEGKSDIEKSFTYGAAIIEHEDFYMDDYYDDFIKELKKYTETID